MRPLLQASGSKVLARSSNACGVTGSDWASYAGATGGVTVTQGLVITFDEQGLPSPNGGTAIVDGRSIIVEADTGHVR